MGQQQAGSDEEADAQQGQKLHIGLVHWSFPPVVGGVETHLWDYSKALARRGHRVTVFTGSVGAHRPCDGVKVIRHKMLDLSAGHEDNEATLKELREWFRSRLTSPGDPIRLIHGHNLHHFSSAPARALKALQSELNLVLLHTYHSIWRTDEGERIARECAVWDVHHAVSDFLVKECREVLRQGAKRTDLEVERTYLGVDTRQYESIPEVEEEPGRHPVVLLPARLIPNKGADVAILMLKLLVERAKGCRGKLALLRPRLVLTDPFETVDFHGERGQFRGKLSKLVEVCELSEGPGQDVEFRPAGIEDMRKLYQEATVVVYPSRFDEPMGLAPLEAMCAARPVVATGVGGLGEGGSALVTPDQDAEKLASRLADELWPLLTEPSLARKAGYMAREHVRDRFDLEEVYVDPMLDEYWTLLATGPGPYKGDTRQPSGSPETLASPSLSTSTVSR
ncbi:glycosyltransferase family 4 protein [Streptomyces sp. NBC_00620]|uniref:glycosyltransferase family 4 protein n=1 Tax=Streptomyces sp. NBC_00620 TaxID=2903666 RepID=UPI0022568DCB|nr:glycosyltransferase family 4 protein [Streptomyces sp. NBC_00620]MCX4975469.1 glycosyltransferase family 4 protein [Streptomyces sp. NBC_00620]